MTTTPNNIAGEELYDEAVAVVRTEKRASTSLLQRRLKIGYLRAQNLIELLAKNGIIGPEKGAKPREVYETSNSVSEEWEKEFDEKFNDNFVYWQELAAEIKVGDPDFKSLKAFIHKTRQEAYQAGMIYMAEKILASDAEKNLYEAINQILTPGPDTSKE